MIDSGCAMDLISKRELRDEERRIKFNTANGNTSSELAITFDIETLAECALVRILDSTPAVLSMGMRCMRMGYSFHWPAGYNPVFIRPDGKHVKLKVIGDIPYLTEAFVCHFREGHRTIQGVAGYACPNNHFYDGMLRLGWRVRANRAATTRATRRGTSREWYPKREVGG